MSEGDYLNYSRNADADSTMRMKLVELLEDKVNVVENVKKREVARAELRCALMQARIVEGERERQRTVSLRSTIVSRVASVVYIPWEKIRGCESAELPENRWKLGHLHRRRERSARVGGG